MELYSIINWYVNADLYNNYDEQDNSKFNLPKYRYLEKRNKYVWWIGFVYIYGLIDAIVDAHLHQFDNIMNEDIYLTNSLGNIKEKFIPINEKILACMFVDPLCMMTHILEMQDH